MYEIHTSAKAKILADSEDMKKFIDNSASGKFIKLKQGIVNPNHVVAIVEAKDQSEVKVESLGYMDYDRNVYVKTGTKVTSSLKDIFAESEVYKQLTQ